MGFVMNWYRKAQSLAAHPLFGLEQELFDRAVSEIKSRYGTSEITFSTEGESTGNHELLFIMDCSSWLKRIKEATGIPINDRMANLAVSARNGSIYSIQESAQYITIRGDEAGLIVFVVPLRSNILWMETNRKSVLSTLSHELQHYIDAVSGSKYESGLDYMQRKHEIRAYSLEFAQAMIDILKKRWRKRLPVGTRGNFTLLKLIGMNKDMITREIRDRLMIANGISEESILNTYIDTIMQNISSILSSGPSS